MRSNLKYLSLISFFVLMAGAYAQNYTSQELLGIPRINRTELKRVLNDFMNLLSPSKEGKTESSNLLVSRVGTCRLTAYIARKKVLDSDVTMKMLFAPEAREVEYRLMDGNCYYIVCTGATLRDVRGRFIFHSYDLELDKMKALYGQYKKLIEQGQCGNSSDVQLVK
jgi:hypothetical protein